MDNDAGPTYLTVNTLRDALVKRGLALPKQQTRDVLANLCRQHGVFDEEALCARRTRPDRSAAMKKRKAHKDKVVKCSLGVVTC